MNSIQNKTCQNCKNDFTIEPDDFGFYRKMDVPAPDVCAQCRQQLRTLFRNFKNLYKRPSSLSGKNIVSVYHEQTPFPVYDVAEWWSDVWDPMDYGIDVDLEQSFFSQITELFNTVPHIAMHNSRSENCEYANQVVSSKNCYLAFGCLEDEDCDYGHIIWNCRDTVDNLYMFKCESCYESIDCLGSNKLFYSQECESCVDSIGLFDCRNCLNCIGCVGLINKSYHIFNQPVSREEYKEFLIAHPLSDRASLEYILKKRDALRRSVPQRFFVGSHNQNVSGNHIYNAYNIHSSFDVKSGENSKYCFTVREAIDSYDVSFSGDASECYQALTMIGSNKVMGSQTIGNSHDIYYSDNCYGSTNLFGCYGLRKKSYCILNKQYNKEEYLELKEKIIVRMKERGDWGRFFPKEVSPFAYNESIANEYMSLSKEEALSKGFRWKDDMPSTKGQGTVNMKELPQDPQEYTDELAKEVLTCEECEKNFKMINREINFYKKNNLALPLRCFNCRHALRMSKRTPRDLWVGKCAKCEETIHTSYREEEQSQYKIYCEKCYQQEVY